jgi:ATP dependent DNA ligase-like protein
MQFIIPAQPKLRAYPPVGDGWIHEAKFDGWRIQLHKDGDVVRLYTKNGYDCTNHFQASLLERKDLLMVLVMGAGDDRLRLSDAFDDGIELFLLPVLPPGRYSTTATSSISTIASGWARRLISIVVLVGVATPR